jgi:hypothetical protein
LTPRELEPLIRRALSDPSQTEAALTEIRNTFGTEAIDPISWEDEPKAIHQLRSNYLGGDDWTSPPWGSEQKFFRGERAFSELVDKLVPKGSRPGQTLETWQVSPTDVAVWFASRTSSFTFARSRDSTDLAVAELLRRLGGTCVPDHRLSDLRMWELRSERLTSRSSNLGRSVPAYLDGTVPEDALAAETAWALHRGLGTWQMSSCFALHSWRERNAIRLNEFVASNSASDQNDAGTEDYSDRREFTLVRSRFRSVAERASLARLRENGQTWFFRTRQSDTRSCSCIGKVRKPVPLSDYNLVSNPSALGRKLGKLYLKISRGAPSTSEPRDRLAELILLALEKLREAELQNLFLYWIEHAWLRPALNAFDGNSMERFPRLGARWIAVSPPRSGRHGRVFLILSDPEGTPALGIDVRTKEVFEDLKPLSDFGDPQTLDRVLFGDVEIYRVSVCGQYVYHLPLRELVQSD